MKPRLVLTGHKYWVDGAKQGIFSAPLIDAKSYTAKWVCVLAIGRDAYEMRLDAAQNNSLTQAQD